MKIILISPYPNIQAFGIRTLSAILKKEHHSVEILFLLHDFTDRYEETTLNQVLALSKGADLIGITLMTNFFDNAVQITEKLKSLHIPILWGGVHPTIRPAECLEHADMICIGEGEKAMLELVTKMQAGQAYHDVRGMWFKNQDTIVKNNMRPLIEDLDSIAFPDYEYQTHYVLEGQDVRKMDQDLFYKYVEGLYMTIPTRGCPFGCSYCCNNSLNHMYPSQKLPRKRSVDSLIAEITQVKTRLPGIRMIKFDDDAFFVYSLAEIKEFCDIYKQTIGLPLIVTGVTPSTLTREKLALLVDAGLVFIRMGVQTASARSQKLYQRHTSNQQDEKAARILNMFKDRIGAPQYDIILDNPWETDQDSTETLMFLSKLPVPFVLCLYSLTFYPETDLYRKAREDGFITDDLTDVYRKHYHPCKKTYLNDLFILLDDYAKKGRQLSPQVMSLLTNQTLRRLKVTMLIYTFMRLDLIARKHGRKSVSREIMRYVQKWDWTRLKSYIKDS